MMPPQTIQHISVENILLRILVSVILKKENGGLSSARNIGIERSIGTYLTFVDSSYLETLYELMIKYNVDVSIVYYGAYDEERAYEYGDEYENVYSGRKVVEQLPKFEGGDSTLQTSCVYCQNVNYLIK